ncbi:MAG TPA: dTDP-4-dehydrorhamnose reductase [Bacteroidales bacterium]|nr:dTDP-4-dehydrorhamnose reductase [Bacteroidales bacterium]
MEIIVTGANGQLGQEFRELGVRYPDYRFTFIDMADLDLTDERRSVSYFERTPFQVIINCAAYTAVDKAEKESMAALEMNATVPGRLARLAAAKGALIIHFSTDYVFNGLKKHPYTEEDPTQPISIYGATKNQGEQEIRKQAKKGIIIRTSWLFSPFGNNFVRTILAKAKEGNPLRVVCDQAGTPTYARDLAAMVLDLLPSFLKKENVETYHYSNEGETNWYHFAKKIIRYSGIRCKVSSIYTGDYPTAAIRPPYAVLSKDKIRKEFGIGIPHWKDSLEDCIARLRMKGDL